MNADGLKLSSLQVVEDALSGDLNRRDAGGKKMQRYRNVGSLGGCKGRRLRWEMGQVQRRRVVVVVVVYISPGGRAVDSGLAICPNVLKAVNSGWRRCFLAEEDQRKHCEMLWSSDGWARKIRLKAGVLYPRHHWIIPYTLVVKRLSVPAGMK
jgi:hypothetical protein